MTTSVKATPEFSEIATGDNMIIAEASRREYRVGNIQPYPNNALIAGKTYTISDPIHGELPVLLRYEPGSGLRTAVFELQLQQESSGKQQRTSQKQRRKHV